MEDNKHHISDELIAAFLDGNVSAEEAGRVLSAIGTDEELREILSLSESIDSEMEREERRIIPMTALAAANPENMCSFECEAFILRSLGHDIDHWTLLETAKANNWLREEGTPLHHVGRLLELKGLHVERKYDSSSADIEDALRQGKYVMAVVDKDILAGGKTGDRPRFHAILVTMIDSDEGCDVRYMNISSGTERLADGGDFLSAWRRSGFYMVVASKASGGYNPRPISVEDIDLDADLEDLTEAIAENAHDIWARARMDEGWTYGPVRDDAMRQHPDLIPYAQLPDSEKEYDRIMAMNTLRLVRRLGFDIINRNKTNK